MTQTPFDPVALWRDMLSQWEKGFKELAGKNVAPPEFMATLMGRYLTAMNMPSRTDLAMLNERLQRIENQLARLAEQKASGPGEPRGGKTAARAGQGQHAAPPNGPASAGTDTRTAGPAEATRRSSPRRSARKKKS